MLRGYRHFIAALGLALACTNHAYAEGGKQQSQAEQSVAKSLGDIAAANNQQAERAERADKDEAPCGQGKYGSNADLCAQWKAADAATDSAWWAWVAAISTIISTAAVLVAICLTHQSNAIARDTAKRQLRAYISVGSCSIEELDGTNAFMLTARLVNAGQTPAYKVRIFGESYGAPYPMIDDRPFQPVEDGYDAPVAPGHEICGAYTLATGDNRVAYQQVFAGEMGMYIQGVCTYEDAFGECHSTTFRYVFGGRVAKTSGLVMHAAKTGNSAT